MFFVAFHFAFVLRDISDNFFEIKAGDFLECRRLLILCSFILCSEGLEIRFYFCVYFRNMEIFVVRKYWVLQVEHYIFVLLVLIFDSYLSMFKINLENI